MAHRALPGAYVCPPPLRDLFGRAMVKNLAAWAQEPVLPPWITFGRHRGARGVTCRKIIWAGSWTGQSWGRTSSSPLRITEPFVRPGEPRYGVEPTPFPRVVEVWRLYP